MPELWRFDQPGAGEPRDMPECRSFPLGEPFPLDHPVTVGGRGARAYNRAPAGYPSAVKSGSGADTDADADARFHSDSHPDQFGIAVANA